MRSVRLIDDVKLEGPIPKQLADARAEIRRLQPTRRALGSEGSFEDMPLVLEDAWLEGIVNAAVHRSYSMAGDLMNSLAVSRPVVQRELNMLRDAGIVEWVGKSRQDPRAYWRLKAR